MKIYVEVILNKGGDIGLREPLIQRLKREKGILVVNSEKEADRVLAGFGETFVKGYLGRNHRVR